MRDSRSGSTSGARRARAGLAGALILALAGAGCIFQPREPESPGGGTEVKWVPPQALGNALGNMKRALESKVLTNYGRSFSSASLTMVLDPADLADLGDNEFETWSAAQEEQRMLGILNQAAATLSVTWTVRDSLEESSSVRYYRDLGYRLTFTLGGKSVTYSGLVDLYFEDDGGGLWFITKWTDKRDGSSNRTWGWLRGRRRVEFPAAL